MQSPFPGPDLPLDEKPGDSYVQSLARGLAVIRSFNAERPAQTLAQVAQATGLTRAGARRLLLTLEKLGYMRSDGRQFRLTPKILDLGFSYLCSVPFWELSQPVLEDLAAEVGESCSISVLEGTDVLYVLRVPARKIMSINLSVGSRLPAYCSAMGRVLLAGLGRDERMAALQKSRLSAHTDRTLTQIQAIMDELDRVREQGWALVYRELEDGLLSLAAPIVNRQGEWVAAMNVSGHALTWTSEDFPRRFLPPLQAAAAKVSGLMV